MSVDKGIFMKHQKNKVDRRIPIITGGIFSVVGLYFTVVLAMPLQFNVNPQVWFSAEYYTQFIPFYTAFTLLFSGALLMANLSQVNFNLAFFGHTASEEILFSLIGLTKTQLPLSAISIFLPLSLIALWLGYFNVLNQKRLSVVEAILGFVVSTAFILLPRFS